MRIGSSKRKALLSLARPSRISLTCYEYDGDLLTFVGLELPATRFLVHGDPLQLPILQFQHHYDVPIITPPHYYALD
jgi:hypothetical protein